MDIQKISTIRSHTIGQSKIQVSSQLHYVIWYVIMGKIANKIQVSGLVGTGHWVSV